MIKIYQTPYGDVHIPVGSPIITVRTSGGFDSGLLLYLVAQTCAELNPSAVIQPITVVRTNQEDRPNWHRVDNRPIVDNIVEWVQSQVPTVNVKTKQWTDAIEWWTNGNVSYTDAQRNLVKQNYRALTEDDNADYVCGIHDFNGVTKNPPVPMTINNMHQHREIKRDVNDKNAPAIAENSCTVVHNKDGRDGRFVEPFRNADKRVVMWLSNNLGIIETLDTLTRSCEGGREETDNWTKVCGTCWWCQERDWAKSAY